MTAPPRIQIVRFPDEPTGGSRPRVRRLTAEIEIDGRAELVAVLEDERGLRAVSSDGATDGPYVAAALELFRDVFERRGGEPTAAHVTEKPAPSPRDELRNAVDELVTAAVRAGIDSARTAPAFKLACDSLVRLTARMPALGLERFLGRLKNAVEFGDVEECAMLLGGATQLVADLAEETPSERALERIFGWAALPGFPACETPLYEQDFVELGREWVAGVSRAALERRYLVELGSGRIYREIVRGGRGASVGPSPRFVRAGLAIAGAGAVPPTLKLLQYEVSPEVPTHAMEALAAHAHADVGALVEVFRAAHAEAPGQAEPFVLFSPARVIFEDGSGSLVDGAGRYLPLASSEGLELDAALRRECDDQVPCVVAGRLFLSSGGLILRPFAVLLGDGPAARLTRLR